MCYVRLDNDSIGCYGRELSTAEWIQLGEAAANAGTLRLTITGGEPLIRKDFSQIYKEFTEMGFLITLQTNLALLDGKVMELIAKRPPMLIKSTLYGASEEMYERVCGVKNGLAQVRRGIENVRQAEIPLTLVATVIKDNHSELNAIHQLAAEYGYSLQHTHNVLDSRRNENGDAASKQRVTYESLRPEEKADVQIKLHVPQKSPLEICGNYRYGGYWILWDGQMSLCAHMKMRKRYNPLEEQESENGIEICFYRMREDLRKEYPDRCCANCKYGEYCTACPAVLYTRYLSPGTDQCRTMQKLQWSELCQRRETNNF